jgi:hypothetical protein
MFDHSMVGKKNSSRSVISFFFRLYRFPISILLGFSALVNASILTNGFLKFCSTITTNDSRITSCTQLNQLFFEQYPNVSMYFLYMLLAIIGSWLQLTLFIGVIAILTIRLGSSFDWSNDNDKQINEKPIMMQNIEKTLDKNKRLVV